MSCMFDSLDESVAGLPPSLVFFSCWPEIPSLRLDGPNLRHIVTNAQTTVTVPVRKGLCPPHQAFNALVSDLSEKDMYVHLSRRLYCKPSLPEAVRKTAPLRGEDASEATTVLPAGGRSIESTSMMLVIRVVLESADFVGTDLHIYITSVQRTTHG